MKAGFKGALWGAVSAGVANGIGTAFSGTGTGAGAAAARSLAHGLTRAAISKGQGGRWSEGFWSGFASSALGGTIGRAKTLGGQMSMAAIVGGTASKLGGGKFANGAFSGAFVHMYNNMSHILGKQSAKYGASEQAGELSEALGVNKSMTNIIKSGAGGLAAGIVGGIIAVAFLPFTVSVFAVATFGGAIGLTAGLVEGAAMESFGINDRIENIKVDTHDYVFNCSCGQPRGHH